MRATLAAAKAAGRAAVGGWVSSGGEFSLGVYRRAAYDYVCIDCQHALLDEASAAALVQRTPPGSPATLVRVSKNDAALIGKIADAGADGVIVPMIETVGDAVMAVRAVHYPPRGVRSYGPMRPDLRICGLPELESRVAVIAMIETRQGLSNVDEICAVPGLSGVYLGPADLSVALGFDPKAAFSSDQLAEAVQQVSRACRANGLAFGMHQSGPDTARRWIERGVDFVSLGTDGATFATAVTDQLWKMQDHAPTGVSPSRTDH
jgi:4-hydroxy-2-oxoheptanedioate aldolase